MKPNLRKNKLILILSILCFQTLAQSVNTVTGLVTDASKVPLPGVSIAVEGTTKGTTTDKDGKYSITSVNSNDKLVFSYVSYVAKKISINNQSIIDIILVADNKALDEVVVVGYGTVKKSNLTGSVTTIKSSDLKQTPIVSLDQGLQGRAAGVQVTQNSGAPGGVVSIRIRGGNSISSSNEPLYVIDGFPVSGAAVSPSGPGFGSNQSNSMNALAGLNPNDIESLEILKDASATAIYGSRGANGVVLITTKRGKSGKTKVEYESYYGMQSVNRTLPLMNVQQYVALEDELSSGRFSQNFGTYDPNGTDWQAELFRQAPINSNQINISGGSDKTQFSISTNYFAQQGIIKGSDFKRGTFRVNLDHSISNNIKIGSNLTLSKINSNVVNNSLEQGAVWTAVTLPPIIPIRDANGLYTRPGTINPGYAQLENPLAMAEYMKNEYNTNRILGNIFAEWQILKNLSYRASLGADNYNDTRNVYQPRTTYAGFISNGTGGRGVVDQFTYIHESILNWNPTLSSNHSLNLTGVFSTQSQSQVRTSLTASNFPADALEENSLNLAAAQSLSTSKSLWRLDSYTARANYAFKNKYLVSLTSRIDGSSRFGDGNKYGFFPSAAFAWRVIEEEFMKKQSLISDLKLRASYGLTGNAEVPLYQSLFKLGASTPFDYVFNNSRSVGIGAIGIPNPNLKWEKTSSYNGGLDLSLFNNKLNLTADVYYKLTSDLLLARTIPSSSGFTTFFGNFGQVENKGIELGITANLSKRDFKFNTSANISFNRNKIVKIDGNRTEIIPADNAGGVANFSNNSILRVGQPVGTFFGYVFDGIWQTADNIATSHMPAAKPGNARYKDLNGDGKLTDADRTIIGNPNPNFIYGFSSNGSYKNIDFSFFFQGVQGNQVFNVLSRIIETAQGGSNQRIDVINRWTPTNPSSTYVKATSSQRLNQSDKYIEDGSFLRLKNVTLGYTVSLTKVVTKMRIYAAANNLFTITKYWGFDPEVNTTGQSDVTNFGIDNGGFPVAKSLILGLQVTF
jgi:TonB-linked SusC/RagA family outer membrane protein